jgi:hypothetical protein
VPPPELPPAAVALLVLAPDVVGPVAVPDTDAPAAPDEGSFEDESEEQPMSTPSVIAENASVETTRKMEFI